jgi:ribosome maturation protein SDO1
MKGQGMIQPGKLDLDLAKLKKGGAHFEIVIDPDLAIEYKNKKEGVTIKDVLKSELVFADANKGLKASETKMQELFNTTDPLKVAEIIINDGDIHFTADYREAVRETKRKRILDLIQRNAMDPRTKLPHPMTRLENAMKEAKIGIDMFKSAEEQVEEVLKKLRPIIPIRIEMLNVQVSIAAQYAHQSYRILKKYSTIKKEAWGGDGSLVANLELPAGLQEEFLEKLNSLTHGGVDYKVLKE